MNITKIDWAEATWNPVTGCLHGCEYCYARKIAERFGGGRKLGPGVTVELETPLYGKAHANWNDEAKTDRLIPYPYDFTPTLHAYRLEEPARKTRPRTIFVCSMADLFGAWVPDSWIRQVFEACERAPQHRYLFLTKSPEYIWRGEVPIPIDDNFWYGTTVSTNEDLERIGHLPLDGNRFISIEPMLEPIDLDARPSKVAVPFADWVIIGAETGNRKGRVIPEKRWVDDVTRFAHERGAKVFMKESLRGLMGADFIHEFPWEVRT